MIGMKSPGIRFALAVMAAYASADPVLGDRALAQDAYVDCSSASLAVISSSRALGKAIKLLAKERGFLVSYEEAPAEFSEDIEYLVKDGVQQTFGVARKYNLSVSGPTPLALDDAMPTTFDSYLASLLKAHEAAGGVGDYEIRRWGNRVGVVPKATRGEDGKWHPVTPILDLPISIPESERAPADTLQLIVDALSKETGANVYVGTIVNGPSSRSLVHGESVPARELLVAAINEIGPEFTWQLVTAPGTNTWCLLIQRVGFKACGAPAEGDD